jgi:hypothetical protein
MYGGYAESPGQSPIYIVVDALDECPKFPGRPSAREEVLEFVEEIVNLNIPNIHGIRPEMDMITIPSPPQSRALFLVLVSTQAFVYAYIAELDKRSE